MQLLNKHRVKQFIERFPDSEASLNHWMEAAEAADWATPADIVKTFASADGVGDSKFIFDIAHNKYRLLATVWFEAQRICTLKLMTHEEYDKEIW